MPGRGEEKLNVRALFSVWTENCPSTQILVGASLLAIAALHPALMWADPPQSRAGSLPQGYSLLAATRQALQVEIIQRPIHRLLVEHDDLC